MACSASDILGRRAVVKVFLTIGLIAVSCACEQTFPREFFGFTAERRRARAGLGCAAARGPAPASPGTDNLGDLQNFQAWSKSRTLWVAPCGNICRLIIRVCIRARSCARCSYVVRSTLLQWQPIKHSIDSVVGQLNALHEREFQLERLVIVFVLRSAEFLGKSDEKPFRPADVAEPIRVFMLDNFAYELRAALVEPF